MIGKHVCFSIGQRGPMWLNKISNFKPFSSKFGENLSWHFQNPSGMESDIAHVKKLLLQI